MMIKEKAFGRIGFLGNPSDMYGGKCLSFTYHNTAEVTVCDAASLKIRGFQGTDETLDYNGSNDLIKAVIRYLKLPDTAMEVSYHTNIPIGAGLSGSSAIIIAAIRAFNKRFHLGFDKYRIAEDALHVEIEELGIAAGFQDRYVISFGGFCFMDFTGKEMLRPPEVDGFGKVEPLDVRNIPCFLSLGTQPKSSAIVHNSLRDLFLNGTDGTRRKIKDDMDRIAELAVLGRDAVLKSDWPEVGQLMNRNTELRENLKYHLGRDRTHLEKDMEMINKALSFGALGAKVAGSGGAVIVLSEDPQVLMSMLKEFPCLIPVIESY